MEHFFSVFEVKYFSIKELLHKLAEIQKNIAGTLSGKLKRRISWALSYEILPPEITKMWEIAIFGVVLGVSKPMWDSMVFYDFMNFWKFQPLSFG